MTVRTPARPMDVRPGRGELPHRPTDVGPEVGVGARSSRLLLLRNGDEVWLVPGVASGWFLGFRWYGNLDSIYWITGPAAAAVWQSVGAPLPVHA